MERVTLDKEEVEGLKRVYLEYIEGYDNGFQVGLQVGQRRQQIEWKNWVREAALVLNEVTYWSTVATSVGLVAFVVLDRLI